MDWFPPLSPLPTPQGTRFRVFSPGAERVSLLLYGPDRALHLDASGHRGADGVWEVVVPGVGAGQRYNWALDDGRPLVDPYALAVDGPAAFGERPRPPLRDVNRDAAFKGIVVAPPPPSSVPRPRTPWEESVVYELHVRGFTRHESSEVDAPGTYRGLAAKASYLRGLGVTAVELLPVHEFDETEVRHGEGLVNFWGYSPFAWFAPNRRYAATGDPVAEFRAMTDALHEAGLEVLVDVVFNHTGELDAAGPTFNLRALAGEVVYLRDARTGDLANLTGCGNTVRAQHPVVRRLIRDALRWWVHGLGVDGFRFDLATILARDERGALMEAPPLLREIESDPALEGVALVAEAWDAAGGYHVGRWPGGPRWSVWNDRFRDDVRRAWLTDAGDARVLAHRLCGSSDLFGHGPPRSLNYVTAHDGFTLRDVVSYARRHNEANAEGNRDGHGSEVSGNHGVEGPTDDPAIVAVRDRARRNLAATLLLAQGVPMLLAGDEFGRTQKGNNNAYCHDGELTWLDWSDADRDKAFLAFVRRLVHLRRAAPCLRRTTFLEDGEVDWFGTGGEPVDWESDRFGYRLHSPEGPDVVVLVNLGQDDIAFVLPAGDWHVAADTARPDAQGGGASPFAVAPQSLVALTCA